MSQEEWAADIAQTVGREVRRYRKKQGMSAEQLAQKCTAAGLPMKRPVIANLESGRRPTVSLAELLILGKVLEVPPLLLIFPVGRTTVTEVVPGREAPTWLAAKWFTGEEALPWKSSEGWVVSPEDWAAWQDGGEPADRFRWQDRQFAELRATAARADGHRKAAAAVEDPEAREREERAVRAEERTIRFLEEEIRRGRREMRRLGLNPGELRPESAHIDQGDM
ncbi:helix-turn-helix transcriptional regulator [Nocardiopsis sp. CNT-189]|uniref:helix-turn-helix domain-containing protein n=1 Tax=Nocardiopsis oceanisediminis TaxID=2816862 RepID=UPI003B39DA45